MDSKTSNSARIVCLLNLSKFPVEKRNSAPHSFISEKQVNFMKSLKESLEKGEFLVICDFTENYAFVIQDAALVSHWNKHRLQCIQSSFILRIDTKVWTLSLATLHMMQLQFIFIRLSR